MRRPLNILFLLEDLCFGGTQKQSLELARRLDRRYFNPQILTLTGRADLDDAALASGVAVRHMGHGRKAAPLFFMRLKRALRDISPDILVPCTALPNIWGRIWGKLLHIPVIVGTCRGGGAPARQHERFLWPLAHSIVCNSQALIERMRNLAIPAERLVYIANGVDTEYFPMRPIHSKSQACDKPGRNIVCVARLAKDKDHATLLRAFAIVAAKYPDARLWLVGEGPEETALRKIAAGFPCDIAGRIEFAGACIDPRPYYAAGDIFALSSIREGQPNVILEAMSCGLPICATNVGGIPAIVRENKNGLLSNAGDAEGLACNLAKFLDDTSLRERFGNEGRKIVEREFSFEAMVGAHQELFLDLADRQMAHF